MKSTLGFSFTGSNIETERILTFEDLAPRIIPYKNQFANAVTYEISQNRILIQRVDYTIA